eukprot:COSAG01_NODE_4540_length_4935_cov_7.083333_3_plen_327_part_00
MQQQRPQGTPLIRPRGHGAASSTRMGLLLLLTVSTVLSHHRAAVVAAADPSVPAAASCNSCTSPAMQQEWWAKTGLNCPGEQGGACDICTLPGNTAEATKACVTADSAEDCCTRCMQWNAGFLPGGHKPGNAQKCHSWFFSISNKWCGLKNCDGPGKCGDAASGDNFVSGPACVSSADKWGWPVVQLLFSAAAIYTVGGVVYMTRVRGKPLRFPDAIPHLEHWTALVGLCRDGTGLVAHTLGVRHGKVGTTRQSGGAEAFLLPAQQQQKSSRSSKHKSKQKAKGKAKARSDSTSRTTDAPSASDPQQAAATSTASAAGGRWVHVDS